MRRDLYSRADDTPAADGDLAALPEFETSYAFDERYHPSEVTIFNGGPDIATEWLTAPVGLAVPLEEVA